MTLQSQIQNPKSKIIRVLLVDDSSVALTVLKRMLSASSDIKVVATAGNGREALNLIPQVNPDVICTDLHMPVMDGLQFTREVMSNYPLPILLVSVSAYEDSLNAFKVLEAGAVDIFVKPRASFELDYQKIAPELIRKIRILSGVRVFRRKPDFDTGAGIAEAEELKSKFRIPVSDIRIIVIGASTGGPAALQAILTKLPSDFPLPVICIQHIDEGFLQGLIDWLSTLCMMKVETAKAGMIPRPGTIYFPREGSHLKIDSKGRFVLSPEPPLDHHRPSITVTMSSVARYFGDSALGVLLTGMGKDGAEGLQDIKKAGGTTIAQDEESSIVFGMPKQAIELGAAGYILPLNAIGQTILDIVLKMLERGN